jgi:hypothetical protein
MGMERNGMEREGLLLEDHDTPERYREMNSLRWFLLKNIFDTLTWENE